MSVPWQHLNKVLHFVCEFRESRVFLFINEKAKANDRKRKKKWDNGMRHCISRFLGHGIDKRADSFDFNGNPVTFLEKDRRVSCKPNA